MFEFIMRTRVSIILFAMLSVVSLPGVAAPGGPHDPCNELKSKHYLVEGYVLGLKQLERLIAQKEEQIANATKPKTIKALQRELNRLYANRAWFLNAIEDANLLALEAATAINGEGCDVPNLIFVSDLIEPPAPALVPSFGTGPRPLAATVDHRGNEGSFVTNELVVDTAHAAALAKRWDGTILENLPSTTPPLSLVQINTQGVDTSAFAGFNGTLTNARGAVVEVSSAEGLALLTVAAQEAASGVPVAINWSGIGGGYAEMDLMEEPAGPAGWTNLAGKAWSDNPYDWHYLNLDLPQGMGVTEAWTLMDAAGKLDNKIGIGILDMGFRPDFSTDFPPGFQAFSVMAGQDPLMSSNYLGCGSDCDWQ